MLDEILENAESIDLEVNPFEDLEDASNVFVSDQTNQQAAEYWYQQGAREIYERVWFPMK